MKNLNVNAIKGLEELEKLAKKKNVIPAREFLDYLPMFIKSLYDKTSEEEMADLNIMWRERVNLYYPVHIINEVDDKVLITLPPAFSTAPSLNEGSKNSHSVVQFFDNASQKASNINIDQERAAIFMNQLLAISSKNHKQTISDVEYSKIMSKFTGEHVVNINEKKEVDFEGGFDWD